MVTLARGSGFSLEGLMCRSLVVQVMPHSFPSSAGHLCLSLIGVSANRLTGGAMQLTFRRMAFDYYPFHWAG